VGITVLSVVALVASGASPVNAVTYDSTTFLTGLHSPTGIAIDPVDGTIYVANAGGGEAYSVSVFEAGAREPNAARTLIGVPGAFDVAVNPLDRSVYVSSPNTDEVRVYRHGQQTSWTAVSVTHPSGLAFRADGTLFIGEYDNDVVGRVRPGEFWVTSGLPTLDKPTGLAVNASLPGLYVATEAGTVQFFDHFTGPPVTGRALQATASAWSVAFHPANGAMYVADPAANVIHAFPVGIVTPDAEAQLTGSPDSFGVEAHPTTGGIYVSDVAANEVRIYPPPATTIVGVDPASGPVSGGTDVCLTGTSLAMVTAVTIGGVAAPLQTDPTYTRVCVRTPPRTAAGLVDVALSWPGQTVTKSGAFTYTAIAPGPATGVTGTPGKGQVAVSWTPPADTGGSPVASYLVTPLPGGAPCATTGTSCTIGGLTNGAKYRFVVRTTTTAGLSSDSAPSGEITPYIPVSLKVKAKAASYRPARKGTKLIVNYATKPSNASRIVTRSCSNGTALSSAKLCKFTVYKNGKVKVRTKGYRNVAVTVSIQNVPKASTGPTYGPSPTWTRTWRVK
jgi:sugar lactone lactonase YvrE